LPLKPPPHDDNGRVIPHDHEDISNDDWVIRRIPGEQLVFDPKVGGKRISSIAFSPSSGLNGGMSVDLQKQIEDAGLDAQVFVTTPHWIGSVRFNVGQLRNEEFKVGYDPLKDNLYHGEVWGSFTTSKKRRLKQLCVWFVQIENVTIA
jgi:hypothetical protein